MSSVFISDVYFDSKPTISIRDGVALSEGKHVENKFDMEIIETGVTGTLYMNYVLRKEDEKKDFEQELSSLLQGVEAGEIRFGKGKSRGFGKIGILEIHERTFNIDNVSEWLEFSKDIHKLEQYGSGKAFKTWVSSKPKLEKQNVLIKVPLVLTGGISIRKYSSEPKKADFEQITCNGDPVIPGSSWNGAIRSSVKEILVELGFTANRAERLIRQWFGYAIKTELEEKSAPDAQKSLITIGESIICGAQRVPMTRNKINRFDASTIESALYSEICYCGGKTEIEIMVKKDDNRFYLPLLAVLELVLQELCKGYIAVGGQVAVGRGIFEGEVPDIMSAQERTQGQQELLNLIKEEK